MRFAGKTALITGAARGIGLACARRFAQEGATVALCDINAAAGEAAAQSLHEQNLNARFFACDTSVKAEVDKTVDAVADALGAIDILYANAGILRGSHFLHTSEDEWDLVLDTNLKSVFLCGQAVARKMIARGKGGAIINSASIAVLLTAGQGVSYTASKGGVAALTRAMALSLAPHDIRVNAIGPGTVDTEMTRPMLANKTLAATIRSRTPLQRFATADDVAGTVLFLASDDAAYITAQTLYIDGGRLALNYTTDAFSGVPVPKELSPAPASVKEMG